MTELWSLEDELGTVVMKNMYRTGSFVINFSDGSKQVNQGRMLPNNSGSPDP